MFIKVSNFNSTCYTLGIPLTMFAINCKKCFPTKTKSKFIQCFWYLWLWISRHGLRFTIFIGTFLDFEASGPKQSKSGYSFTLQPGLDCFEAQGLVSSQCLLSLPKPMQCLIWLFWAHFYQWHQFYIVLPWFSSHGQRPKWSNTCFLPFFLPIYAFLCHFLPW